MNIKSKIRALLAKTTSAGCTEAEAIAAAQAAQRLMAQYGIDNPDAEDIGPLATRASDARLGLCQAVSKFCNVRGFQGQDRQIYFHGAESDTIFAEWLLDTLEAFVDRNAIAYALNAKVGHGPAALKAFRVGCIQRLHHRLIEMAKRDEAKLSAITADIEHRGIKISAPRRGTVTYRDPRAFAAGATSANTARFDRPVEGQAPRAIARMAP